MKPQAASCRIRHVTRRQFVVRASLVSGALICPSARAAEDIGTLLEPIRKKHKFPGLAAAVIEGSGVKAIGAGGLRKAGSTEALTIEDKFHIGSCTKAMTATLTAMFVERGELAWDTTLAKLFPDLAGTMHADFKPVTLTQLLSHRAGTPASPVRPTGWQTDALTKSRFTYVKETLSKPPVHPPGKKFLYSNGGYVIVGAILEKISGKSWEDLMREMLFAPLGMKSAGFGAPSSADKVDQPWGHQLQGGELKPFRFDNPPLVGPAGTVHCSLADYAKFIGLHFGLTKLLKPETLARCQTPAQGEDYAFGWGVVQRSWAGGKALSHAGSNTMNYFVVWAAPAKKFAVVIATNTGGDTIASVGQGCDEAAGELIKRFAG